MNFQSIALPTELSGHFAVLSTTKIIISSFFYLSTTFSIFLILFNDADSEILSQRKLRLFQKEFLVDAKYKTGIKDGNCRSAKNICRIMDSDIKSGKTD